MIPRKNGGTETYLRGLIGGLAKIDDNNDYVLFCNQENYGTFNIENKNFSKVLCKIPGHITTWRVVWEQLVFPGIVNKNSIDVLHSPGNVMPLKIKCSSVVTVHDMQHLFYFKCFPKYRRRPQFIYWKYFFPLSINKADLVITVSEYSKNDIIRHTGVSDDKIFVIHEASSFADFKNRRELSNSETDIFQKYNIQSNYVLTVSNSLPHKNLGGLINAYDLLTDKIDLQLVIVGAKKNTIKNDKCRSSRRNLKPESVIWLENIYENDLIALYERASLFVMPSLFEGFGIPLVEAMTLGCPVVASNRASIPEITQDAAILFNPEAPMSICEALYSVLSDQKLRNDLIAKGLQRANHFSWLKAAKATIEVYKMAYRNKNGKK